MLMQVKHLLYERRHPPLSDVRQPFSTFLTFDKKSIFPIEKRIQVTLITVV